MRRGTEVYSDDHPHRECSLAFNIHSGVGDMSTPPGMVVVVLRKKCGRDLVEVHEAFDLEEIAEALSAVKRVRRLSDKPPSVAVIEGGS